MCWLKLYFINYNALSEIKEYGVPSRDSEQLALKAFTVSKAFSFGPVTSKFNLHVREG